MKIAFLLALPPTAEDVQTTKALAEAALRQGHSVFLFLNADGVLSAGEVAYLANRGAEIAGCSLSLRQRDATAVPGIRWGSQLDWAEATRNADRVLCFV